MNQKVNDILKEHQLDFNISKRALVDESGNKTGYYGLFNDSINKCIHTVKKGYTVSQNAEIVGIVVETLGKFGELSVTKAGAINDGRKVFIQLGVEGMSKVANDLIERYVTIIDSNDGSTGLCVGIGDLTMSCQNQFNRFWKNSQVKMTHSASLEKKLKELPQLIEIALEKSLKQIQIYNQFASTEVTRELAHKLVKQLLGHDRVFTSTEELSKLSTRSVNLMDSLYENIDLEIADKGLNLWGLHSGVTKFTTHSKSAPKRNNGRMESLLVGGGYKMNMESLNFVSKHAQLELV